MERVKLIAGELLKLAAGAFLFWGVFFAFLFVLLYVR